jgi:hypothetical protein
MALWRNEKGPKDYHTREGMVLLVLGAMRGPSPTKAWEWPSMYAVRWSPEAGVAARELWKMAQEYQAEAAKLGEMPDIGDPPQGLKDQNPRLRPR